MLVTFSLGVRLSFLSLSTLIWLFSFSTTQSDGHKVVKTIDPSIVQAILDRFDHQNRGNTRKRHFSGTDDQFDEESQPAPKLTKSTNNNNLVSLDDSLERIPSVVGSQMESKRSDRSPECSVPVDHHDAEWVSPL